MSDRYRTRGILDQLDQAVRARGGHLELTVGRRLYTAPGAGGQYRVLQHLEVRLPGGVAYAEPVGVWRDGLRRAARRLLDTEKAWRTC